MDSTRLWERYKLNPFIAISTNFPQIPVCPWLNYDPIIYYGSALTFTSGFQTWIGYVDVKSSPVYFYVQKNTYFNSTRTPIPFEVEKLNVGGAMNLTSGKFTAPRAGTYFFAFTGLAFIPGTSSRLYLSVDMYLNGNQVGRGYADENSSAWESFFFQSTLNLQAGDQIWLQIVDWATGTTLFDDERHWNHFTGWLLEESISDTLNVF